MKNLIKNVNGYDVKISTYKDHRGRLSCNAQFGKSSTGSGYSTFSFAMFTDPSLTLAQSEPGKRATDKAIKEIHEAGLRRFNELREAGELPRRDEAYDIQPGQILRFEGYGHENERLAVYETDGETHKVVNLETLAISSHDRVKPIEKAFGIGVYYTAGEVVDMETVNEALTAARAKAAQDAREREDAQEKAAQARRGAIERGKKIIPSIPAGATHVIVAKERENKSDYQTDYFAYETTQTAYLAFSGTGRDSFDEMRKAATNCTIPGVNKYAEKPTKPKDAGEYWTPEDEHREKYSMGAGYYLGGSKYSGWIIEKMRVPDLEILQQAAGEGRYFIPEGTAPAPKALPGTIQVIDYSEKAIAVIGDTKPIKDQLKDMGGRFNFRLSCGVGWVFPKTKQDQVIEFLQGLAEQQKEPLRNEARETVNFLAETDKKIYGEVADHTRQIANVQNSPICSE